MAAKRKYTDQQDEIILSASKEKLLALGQEIGAAYNTLYSRQKLLRKKNGLTRMGRLGHEGTPWRFIAPKLPPSHQISTSRFARPSWFNENLTALTKGAV